MFLRIHDRILVLLSKENTHFNDIIDPTDVGNVGNGSELKATRTAANSKVGMVRNVRTDGPGITRLMIYHLYSKSTTFA